MDAPLEVVTTLPPKADLREFCPPIYDQGDLGSCTAFSIAKGLRETLARIAGAPIPSLAALFLYYQERTVEQDVPNDAGANICDGLASLLNQGCCTETLLPYDISKFTEHPSPACYQEAVTYKVASAHPLADLNAMRSALANKQPVVFGMRVFSSMETSAVALSGVVPMPAPGDEPMGGHAVCAVGYDDDAKHLIVRNSWGAGWGDKGYFYLSYDFVNTYCSDFWTAVA